MFKFKDGQIIIDTKEIKEAVKKAAGTAKDKLGEAKTLVVDTMMSKRLLANRLMINVTKRLKIYTKS